MPSTYILLADNAFGYGQFEYGDISNMPKIVDTTFWLIPLDIYCMFSLQHHIMSHQSFRFQNQFLSKNFLQFDDREHRQLLI